MSKSSSVYWPALAGVGAYNSSSATTSSSSSLRSLDRTALALPGPQSLRQQAPKQRQSYETQCHQDDTLKQARVVVQEVLRD